MRDLSNNLLRQNQSKNDLTYCLNCIWNAEYILKLALSNCPFAWVLSLKIVISWQRFCIGFHATIRALLEQSKSICLAHIRRNSKEIDGRSVCLIKMITTWLSHNKNYLLYGIVVAYFHVDSAIFLQERKYKANLNIWYLS